VNKYVNKVQAILNLVGGDISAVNEDVTYLSGQTPPTEEAIQAEIIRLQAEYDALQYQRDRQPEYPSIEDQLDQIFWQGLDEWKKTVQAVKDAHPKPK
tara:strand:+ start:382 stop:675 length:294 start_codon:yes stop_codon:yes gene_type:complete